MWRNEPSRAARRPAWAVAIGLGLLTMSGTGSAQTAPAGEAAVNPFLPPGSIVRSAAGREEPASTTLSVEMCQAVLGRQAAQQALPAQLEALIGPCQDYVRQRMQADLMTGVRAMGETLKPLMAVGRVGPHVLFRLGDATYRGQIGQAAVIEGRELKVAVNGASIELQVPDAVSKEVGFTNPVVVWRGAVGDGSRSAAAPPAAGTGGTSGKPPAAAFR